MLQREALGFEDAVYELTAHDGRPDVIAEKEAIWAAAQAARAERRGKRASGYEGKRFVPEDVADEFGDDSVVIDRQEDCEMAQCQSANDAELICRLLEAHYAEQVSR